MSILPPPKKIGTGFTNINRVLDVNKGNQLGTTVASAVTNQAQGVKTQTNQSQNKFNQEAQKNRLDTDENVQKRDNVLGRFGQKPDESQFKVSSGVQDQYNQNKNLYSESLKQASVAPAQQTFNQSEYDRLMASSKPANKNLPRNSGQQAAYDKAMKMKGDWDSGAALRGTEYTKALTGQRQVMSGVEKQMSDLDAQYQNTIKQEKDAWLAQQAQMLNPSENEVADFDKFRSGTYAGPKELDDYQTLLGRASEAEQLGGLSRSDGGRQELLRRFVGGEGYNQGQQRLDNLLLGQSGTQGINEARKNTRGLEQQVYEANMNASNTAKELSGRAKIFGDDTVGKLNATRNPLSSQIDSQLKSIQDQEAARNSTYGGLKTMLTGGDKASAALNASTRMTNTLSGLKSAGQSPQYLQTLLEGRGGLVDRGQTAGLDVNTIMAERLKNNQGQNINRGGAANVFQEKQINALDRLLGKQGMDAEFSNTGADYVAGNIGVDSQNLTENILPAVEQKAAADEAARLEQERLKSSGAFSGLGTLFR